jgi:hypothetical protein
MKTTPCLLALLVLLLAFFATAESCTAQKAGTLQAYEAKVSFSKGVAVHYADFDLTYAGARKETSKAFPRGFLFHDFNAVQGTKTVTVSWSSGAGDIGPAPFTIGGKQFQLELSHSDKLGRLKEDELVVSRVR